MGNVSSFIFMEDGLRLPRYAGQRGNYFYCLLALLLSSCNPLGESSVDGDFLSSAGGGVAPASGGSCSLSAGVGTENTAAQISAGYYGWDSTGVTIAGSMTNNGTVNLSTTSPSSAGYYSGFTSGSPTASTICSGTTILGQAGSGTCVTGTADALAGNVFAGKTFWNAAGAAVTGTMTDRSNTWNLTTAFPGSGYYSGITSGLVVGDVCSSKNLLGSAGTATCVTGTADAVAGDVASGKKFWNAAGANVTGTGTVVTGTPDAVIGNVLSGKTFWNTSGAVVTGTMTNQGTWTLTGAGSSFPGAGYYSAVASAPAATNICSGNTVNGVAGSATCTGAAGTGTIAAAGQVCSSYYAYNASGSAINGSATCPQVGTPTTISGLKQWLNAGSITGLTNSSAVTVWTDSSGNENHVYQSTSGSRPLYISSGINSKPILRFDGTDDALINAFFSINGWTAMTAIVVAKWNATTTFRCILGWQANGGGHGAFVIAMRNSGGAKFDFTLTGVDGVESNLDVTVADTSSHIFAMRYASGDTDTFIDGSSSSTNFATETGAIPQAVAGQTIGTYNTGFNASADIAEVLIYQATLSDVDLNTLDCYLSTKYGIAIGHGC